MSTAFSQRKIDPQIFKLHLELFQAKFKENAGFKGATVVAFLTGSNDIFTYNKSCSLQEWFFGRDFSETFVCISEKCFCVIIDKKNYDAFTTIENDDNFFVKFRSDSANSGINRETFVEALTSVGFNSDDSNSTLGIFERDKFGGNYNSSWYEYLADSRFKKIDVCSAVAQLMSVKTPKELEFMQNAAKICVDVFSGYIKPKILDIIDEDKVVKHAKIANDIEDSLEDRGLHIGGITAEDIESPFPPIIQSGGEYALKYSISSDNRPLKYDCVVVLFGVRYRFYCASIARTLMIRPSEQVKSLYSYLLSLYDILLKSLTVDAKFCDVYNIIYSHVKSNNPQYLEYFVKSIGFVTGLEFRESSMIFDGKNTSEIKPGMVFIFLLGFQNFPISGGVPPGCVAIGETIGIKFDGSVEVLTESKRSLASLTVMVSDLPRMSLEDSNQNKARDTKRQPVQEAMINEESRKAHQAELRIKLNEEARRRLLDNEESRSDESKNLKTFDGAYKNAASLPHDSDVLNLKIFVDRRAESVMLPIFGMSVPFHVSCIKSVTSSVEGGCAYLRINFHTITGPASKLEDLSITYGKNVYVKEMIFRSPISKSENSMEKPFNIVQVFNQIKELQKNYKAKLQHENEMKGVVQQADLIINPMKNIPRLRDVQIRPQIGTRKTSGSLEAHSNGLRYVSSKGERLDVLYNNIKHAIFQPCDHETVITIHFHLKAPIMIGKKKYEDVQFFSEVGSQVSDLGKLSNSIYERDEVDGDEKDRELRNSMKQMYKSFIEKVESSSDNIEFEVPFRELGFNGVPHKASVFLMPTTHCLVNVIEIPPFVVSLEEIELVHFERVSFGIKNFDMVIIYKDYKRKVSMISSIDYADLESIKDWLNSCDIKYTESKQNLNWTKIMKTILDDPEDFFANGGWGFLDPDDDEVEEENVESVIEDEEYHPDSSEEVVGESESDFDYVSEESESDYPADDESESGKSWTDLENEARMEDALRYGGRFSPPEKRKFTPKTYLDKKPRY